MEKEKQLQRSLSSSMKAPPAKLFLVFSLTLAISCFLVLLSVSLIWVGKSSSPTHFQQTHHFFLQFNPLFDVNTSTRSSTGSISSELTSFSSEKDANFSREEPEAAEEEEEDDEEVSKVVQEQSTNDNTLFESKFSALLVNNSVSATQFQNIETYPNLSKNKGDDSIGVEEKGKNNGIGGGGGGCDLTKGKWVFDERYPLYTNKTCPYIDEGFNCVGNGRLDKDYMRWRWQPQDCNFPSFNATKMLESIRGKRLVFVGDSLNRNQWESMLCLLMGAIKDPKKVYETRGRRITKSKGIYSFRFVDYKCTVEFYVTHFLVRESTARLGKKRLQTLRIDTIDRGSSRWRGADILVFNTAHWWSHSKTKAGINYYQQGNQIHPHLDGMVAFRRALTTWGSWVDRYVSPRKTRVFFRTSAPSHFRF
ncbi:OLC1v1004409C1 [Oldenlandia corymbosa var. corymbosa]|uniref:OLC1v1004409C1 n=1 Tax=Oldenlandia corymbosa var. corymbosa TaxID=529605 RepID=A0AAV1DC73_OLDCO|nr:OLC1v1004409C1 [Oldenlandia corymbosa var. corymbosa]